MKFEELRNADELRKEFIEILKQFDKDMNEYQTDVYLYVDDDGNGSLHLFVNVGGNSWLNDDHYVLYIDHQHNESILDFFVSEEDIAECIGISLDALKAEAADSLDCDPEDIDCYLLSRYAEEKHYDALHAAYCEYLEENVDYEEKADLAIDRFDMENGGAS